jgi:hypothetical protein
MHGEVSVAQQRIGAGPAGVIQDDARAARDLQLVALDFERTVQ